MPKNEEEWLDIYELPIFTNELSTWKWAENLEKNGNLTKSDLNNLRALLEAAIRFNPNEDS